MPFIDWHLLCIFLSKRGKNMAEQNYLHQKIPFSELLKGVPGIFGIHLGEKPHFEVLKEYGEIEIRQYQAMTLAQVKVESNTVEARKKAFFTLADYIFGYNVGAEKMPMTSPVLQEGVLNQSSVIIPMTTPVFQEQSERGWKMSFVLPEKYAKRSAPEPLNPEVQIIRKGEQKVVALPYHGENTPEKMRAKQVELARWLSMNQYLRVSSEFYFAQYDGPNTIPLFKANEVLVNLVGGLE